VFVFGLVFGSFFNVCIHRWPMEAKQDREWVKTPSNCPHCKSKIRWYDNIPLFGWLNLRGKCRDCKASIAWRYPAVELGNALLWTGTLWLVTNHGLANVAAADIGIVHIAFVLFLASIWLIGMVTDFEHTVIPYEVSIPNFAAALLFLFLAAPHTISSGWLSSLYGLLLFAGFIFIFALFGAMGDGDVHVALGFGIIFGWPLSAVALFLGIVCGGMVAIPLWLKLKMQGKDTKKAEMPFGPWLFLGCYICLFFGNELLTWYLGLMAEPAPLALLSQPALWLR
jgi:leader peptidase (prepilin peptidase)/N-methyltransferase